MWSYKFDLRKYKDFFKRLVFYYCYMVIIYVVSSCFFYCLIYVMNFVIYDVKCMLVLWFFIDIFILNNDFLWNWFKLIDVLERNSEMI